VNALAPGCRALLQVRIVDFGERVGASLFALVWVRAGAYTDAAFLAVAGPWCLSWVDYRGWRLKRGRR